MSRVRTWIMGFGLIGALLFGTAFVVSIVDPPLVERIAKEAIRHQVEKRVHQKIEALDELVQARAQGILQRHADRFPSVRARLEGLSERISQILAEMQDPACECRKTALRLMQAGIDGSIARGARLPERLTLLIQTRYMEVAQKLMREFRIFTGTNAVVFALLAVAALVHRGGRDLLPPAIILTVTAIVAAGLYLFAQNWLSTIIFSTYLGFTYVVCLAAAFAFECDLIFNRGRWTTRLFSAVPSPPVPC